MTRITLRDGRTVETNDEIMRLPHDDDPSGLEWEGDGDLEVQWKRKDRKAWVEYRKWEDVHIPDDPAHPLKDPPGLAEARRAFEKQQVKERELFFKKARYGERG
jgi:hypothetical protein